MTDALTSLHGRRIGLDVNNNLVMERPSDGSTNIVVSNDLTKGSVYKVITSAQLLALNATPISIVTAPGAGLAIVPYLVTVRIDAGTAYGGIAAGEDLVLKYTDGSGGQCSSVIETTGFLDQTTAQVRYAGMPGSTGSTAGSVVPVANAAVVMHLLSGEITTGNSPLYVKVWYYVVPTVFTA